MTKTTAANLKPVVECNKCKRQSWDLRKAPGGTLAGTECGGSPSRPWDDSCGGTLVRVAAAPMPTR